MFWKGKLRKLKWMSSIRLTKWDIKLKKISKKSQEVWLLSARSSRNVSWNKLNSMKKNKKARWVSSTIGSRLAWIASWKKVKLLRMNSSRHYQTISIWLTNAKSANSWNLFARKQISLLWRHMWSKSKMNSRISSLICATINTTSDSKSKSCRHSFIKRFSCLCRKHNLE